MALCSFMCGVEVFVKLFADRIGQVVNSNISNGTRAHIDARERIGDPIRF